MPTISDLAGPAGPLEAILDEAAGERFRAAVVFAHPHPQFGGTMHTKVVY
jgi:alpha/beta superfamily hydrolase